MRFPFSFIAVAANMISMINGVCGIHGGIFETQNPLHSQAPFQYFSKQFYVSYINNYLHSNLFPNWIACLHAFFNPIDNETFFFRFGGLIDVMNYATFNGTITRTTDPDCYNMKTSDYYNNKLYLCMKDNNKEYNYMYVTDMKQKTGFGLIDSLDSVETDDAIRTIMFQRTNGNFHKINHNNCFQYL
jgi:hypothetical protein